MALPFTKDITSPSQQKQTKHPTAYQLRPHSFDDFIGQEHVTSTQSSLRTLCENDTLVSLILWGPPGVGKTSLANIIKTKTKAQFLQLNAVSATIKDIKQCISTAKELQQNHIKTVLFIDEIHRFSKVQQDCLLPDVESGLITLIGATTENPYFSIIPGLISRLQIFELKKHTNNDIKKLIQKYLNHQKKTLKITEKAIENICHLANGDGRKCLNILEQCTLNNTSKEIDADLVTRVSNNKTLPNNLTDHYDMTSALIKSLRGSDADAALYWMTRLVQNGEPAEYIIRRLIIFTSEDIGNADPHALPLATSLLQAATHIGYPEIKINLAHVITYLAYAPKSNRAYKALKAVEDYTRTTADQPVPTYLRQTSSSNNYIYPHSHPEKALTQKYWNEETQFYYPQSSGFEEQHVHFQKKQKALKTNQTKPL